MSTVQPLDEPPPQTEASVALSFRPRGPVADEWGRSESIDPDDVGDIADEGAGHRVTPTQNSGLVSGAAAAVN
jgi:hypothetical protein